MAGGAGCQSVFHSTTARPDTVLAAHLLTDLTICVSHASGFFVTLKLNMQSILSS